jgi:hypothetical protein
MMLTLISMLGGGLMRLLPEVFALFKQKNDNAHELAMLDKQLALEQTRSAMRQDEIRTQGEADMNLAQMTALGEALKGQMQLTNMWFIDALNFAVRPMSTYYLLAIYGLVKLAMYQIAIAHGTSGWEAILKVYDDEDRAILGGIVSFWFVGRSVDRNKGLIK